ncbi:MAG: ankyrin repeat domain-containing protein [Chlamydiota bacterium]
MLEANFFPQAIESSLVNLQKVLENMQTSTSNTEDRLHCLISRLKEKIYSGSYDKQEISKDVIAINKYLEEHQDEVEEVGQALYRSLQTVEGIVKAQGLWNNLEHADENQVGEALLSIKDIELRIQLLEEARDYHSEIDIGYIDQDYLTAALANYLKARSEAGEVDIEEIEAGVCLGLSVLYGYYQLTGKQDDFFAQIEGAQQILTWPSNLKDKRYQQLDREELDLEHLCNDIIFFQDFMGQAYPLQKLKMLSDAPIIRSLEERLFYVSPFFPEEAKYSCLTETLRRLCTIDEQPKLFWLMTTDHAIALFYREHKVYHYDPRNPLPSLPYQIEKIDELVDIMVVLLETKKQSFSLSIDLVTAAPLPSTKQLDGFLEHSLQKAAENHSLYDSMYLAVEFDHPAAIKALVDAGFDLNDTNEDKMTALHWAAYFGRLTLARELVRSGAKVDLLDAEGETPSVIALQEGHMEVANFLHTVEGHNKSFFENKRKP